MQNKPGISWGPDKPVNLVHYLGGWKAVYHYPDGGAEVIKVFKTKNNYLDEPEIMKALTIWNYGTCELCPIVKLLMDMTA